MKFFDMEGFLLVGSVLKMLTRFLGKADICLKFSDAWSD